MFSYHNYYPNFVCVIDSCQRENKARAHAIIKASGLKTLIHGTVRKSYKAVARQAIGHHRVREHVLCLLKRDLQMDLVRLCTKRSNSLLRGTSVEAVNSFTWDSFSEELAAKGPTLFAVLNACVNVKQRKRSTTSRKGDRLKT